MILIFTRYYRPGFKGGGPVRSIENVVEWLGDRYSFRIVTSDRDYTEAQPYPDITVGVWSSLGKAEVIYLSPAQRSLLALRRLLRTVDYDVVYLNSFFDSEFTIIPLLLRRMSLLSDSQVIIAPRGELSPGRLRLKAWKKTPFLKLSRAIGLYRDLVWQASSYFEKGDIEKAVGAVPEHIQIAPNLASPHVRDVPRSSRRVIGEPLRVCFLSRISPEKNLDFALEALRHASAWVLFEIYGPIRDDGEHWATCKRLMSLLPANVQASYKGPVEPDEVATVLSSNDLLFLPSRGENFGHVIMESLTAGTPVLISDTTPWRDLAAKGIGWDLSLGSSIAFAQKIDAMARMSEEEVQGMRQKASAFAATYRLGGDALAATQELLLKALER